MANSTPFNVEFTNPPVVEVVCGITFEYLNHLLVPHFGLLWEKFKHEYPECQEQIPLEPIFESYSTSVSEAEIEFSSVPELPRIFFIANDEKKIIQVQRDRFIHNWKKVKQTDEYPRFQTVISTFRQQLSIFESFLQEKGLGEINLLGYELAYVNLIPAGNGWDSLKEIGKIFPDLLWRSSPNRLLLEPESVQWNTAFNLPDNAGIMSVNIKNVLSTDDKQIALLMTLGARSSSDDTSSESLWEWFDLAHDWIVRGFVDLTSLEIQNKVWGRKYVNKN